MFLGLKPLRVLGGVFLLLLLAGTRLFAGEDWTPHPIGPFFGLNDRDNSFAIPEQNAQALLNVELTPGGKSFRKRKGFGLQTTLTNSAAVHGVYTFYDSNGNSVDLYANSTYLSSSIGGGAATVLFSTGPSGATYQCADSAGFAYCANTSRTTITKTNGSTYSNITSVNSTGTMVAACVTRLAMAGFSDSPSRIDLSQDGDFTTWTTGSLGTSAAQFTINSPGAKITHLTYAFGRLIWFKDTSFGYIFIGNQPLQTDWMIRTISFDVGTNDNTSVYREGILYFRGKDNHFYAFDGSNYRRISREIATTIGLTQTRGTNYWTQTSVADFNSGFIDVDIDSTSMLGSLQAKTTYWMNTSASDWGAGSFTDTYNYADTQTVSGNLQLTFPDEFTTYRDGTSNTKSVWTKYNQGGSDPTVTISGNELKIKAIDAVAGIRTITASPLSFNTTTYFKMSTLPSSQFNMYLSTFVAPAGSAPVGWKLSFIVGTPCTFNQVSIAADSNNTDGAFSVNGTCFALPINVLMVINPTGHKVLVNNTNLVNGAGTHTWFNRPMYVYHETGGTEYLDRFGIAPETFTYTSSSFNTGISTPIWGLFHDALSGDGSATYTSQVSADNSSFDSGVSVTSGSLIISAGKKFIKINHTFTETLSSGTVLSSAYFDLNSGSSGTYRSAVKNPTLLTAWDAFVPNYQNNGGSNTFFIRSSSNNITVNSSTPSWTSISAGAVPTVSTGTGGVYFQIRDDFYSASSTQTPKLDDFTQNWFEGNAADKAYATYFNDQIWWSVTNGTGATTNNRDLVYDLLNKTWLVHDIPSNGFLVRNNRLYFGHATTGNIYKYGDIDNDAGAAINAYWKSKDFFGTDPFKIDEIANISIIAKGVQNSSATVTYTIDGNTSSSYTMNLYNSGRSFINNNKNLPAGTNARNSWNVQVGNNAVDQPFEIFGIQIGLRPNSWVPTQ